mgnify:CR=1 FL=1
MTIIVIATDIAKIIKTKIPNSGIIVLSYPDLAVIDRATHKSKVTFPYVPGLLSFREIPGLLKCFNTLKTKPEKGITTPEEALLKEILIRQKDDKKIIELEKKAEQIRESIVHMLTLAGVRPQKEIEITGGIGQAAKC